MVTKTPNIIVTDENGSRTLEGQELELFLLQRDTDLQKEAELRLAAENEYNAKVIARTQVIERLGLTQEEANLLFPPIPKPIYLN